MWNVESQRAHTVNVGKNNYNKCLYFSIKCVGFLMSLIKYIGVILLICWKSEAAELR